MKRTLLTSIIAIMLTIPVYADIASDATNASCDGATLSGATNGSVNLSADWTENTINLTWYNDSVENNGTAMDVNTNSAQCMYNHGITLPPQPTKQGYTFAGWRVRQCSLNIYYDETWTTPIIDADHVRWKPINQTGFTMVDNGWVDRSGDLEFGQWGVTFSTGEIRGRAICTNVAPSNLDTIKTNMHNGIITEEQAMSMLYGDNGDGVMPYDTFDSNSMGRYCWCVGTEFASCHVAAPSWVFNHEGGDADDCAYDCADYCARYIIFVTSFRQAVFGVPVE